MKSIEMIFNNETITYGHPKFLEIKVEILEATLYETIHRLEWLEKEWSSLRVMMGLPFTEAKDFIDYVERLKTQIKK